MAANKVYDVTALANAAELAATQVDIRRQYCLDDVEALERKVRAAYIHGWMEGNQAKKIEVPLK